MPGFVSAISVCCATPRGREGAGADNLNVPPPVEPISSHLWPPGSSASDAEESPLRVNRQQGERVVITQDRAHCRRKIAQGKGASKCATDKEGGCVGRPLGGGRACHRRQ
jgi:hypothetical protein